jgi:probable rRNA maturation factor
MGELHARFFDDPAPTDVITFPGDAESGVAGEICVCADVARDYAARQGCDPSRELALYLLHGYLHLAGYDDRDPAGRARMRRAERAGMKIIEAANAIPPFRFATRRRSRKS